MNNFLDFIIEDTNAKRTLFLTLPTNTKRNIKKYNEKVDTVYKKYVDYKSSVKKYLDMKSKSFEVKKLDRNSEKLKRELDNLENIKSLLNPMNTYFEKMEFDSLMYEISDYYNNKDYSLGNILDKFLDKFKLINIELKSEDFKYTYYVNKYMNAFFELKESKKTDYKELSEIFEKIYWTNPKIIEHIELNLRKLIKKHEKKFIEYISRLQKETKEKNNIVDFHDCTKKIKTAFVLYLQSNSEDLFDIIEKSKKGEIDPALFFKEAKFRKSTFENIVINPIDENDCDVMNKLYETLEKLKINVEEYANYLTFYRLIEEFKKDYNNNFEKNKNSANTVIKIEKDIIKLEKALEKFNKKIFLKKAKNKSELKNMKLESIKKAEELYEMYLKYDERYFLEKVIINIDETVTIFEFLQFYYSYNFYKKNAIRKVFKTKDPEEIEEYNNLFNSFSKNPLNLISKGTLLFENVKIDDTIVNRYKLVNINLSDDDLDLDSLKILLDKIQFMLRVREVERSSLSFDKIWFISQVSKINKKDNV